MSKPFVTVLVPTRERATTLAQTLETCVSQDADQYEILVSDNASIDNTPEVTAEFQQRDARVRVINPGRRLSMSSHWEWAFGHVKEGYLVVIGDDDGMVPGSVKRIQELAAEYELPDAITWPISYYHYPNLEGHPNAGSLLLSLREGAWWRDTAAWKERLYNFRTAYYELPTVYHNAVNTRMLDVLRSKGDGMLRSRFPDVYTGVVFAATAQRVLRSARSLSVNAISPASTGYSYLMPKADPARATLFNREAETMPLHLELPFFNNLHVITAEAMLQARDHLQTPEPHWTNLVRLLYFDWYMAQTTEHVTTVEIEKLREMANRHGVGDYLQELETRSSSEPYWNITTSLEVQFSVTPHEVNLNLVSAGVENVIGATRMAAVFQEAIQQISQEKVDASGESSLPWQKQIKELREQQTALQNDLDASKLDVERLTPFEALQTSFNSLQSTHETLQGEVSWLREALAIKEQEKQASALHVANQQSMISHLAARAEKWQKKSKSHGKRASHFKERFSKARKQLKALRKEPLVRFFSKLKMVKDS